MAKKVKNSVKAHEFNQCRPIVAGEPSRRYYYELASAGKRGIDPKEAHARAAKAWAKDMGMDQEEGVARYKELVPTGPKNVEYFLDMLKTQNKKAGIAIKATFKDNLVRVFAA
jgi:hypothetical protein